MDTKRILNSSTADYRKMKCSVCGHETSSTGIGAVYCGPHKVGNEWYPLIRMTEVESRDIKSE